MNPTIEQLNYAIAASKEPKPQSRPLHEEDLSPAHAWAWNEQTQERTSAPKPQAPQPEVLEEDCSYIIEASKPPRIQIRDESEIAGQEQIAALRAEVEQLRRERDEAREQAENLGHGIAWTREQLGIPESDACSYHEGIRRVADELALIHRTRCQITEIAEEDLPTPEQVRAYARAHGFALVGTSEYAEEWGWRGTFESIFIPIDFDSGGERKVRLARAIETVARLEERNVYAVLSAMRAEEVNDAK